MEKIKKTLEKGGLKIIARHGLGFKLFCDAHTIQIIQSKIIGEEQIKGLWKLADELPDLAGSIMVIAKVKNK